MPWTSPYTDFHSTPNGHLYLPLLEFTTQDGKIPVAFNRLLFAINFIPFETLTRAFRILFKRDFKSSFHTATCMMVVY